MPIRHLFFLRFFVYFLHGVYYFFALVISAFGTSRVRNNHNPAMGAFDQAFLFELQINSGSITSALGMSLLLYRHKNNAKLKVETAKHLQFFILSLEIYN